jgi:hypothetical protein
MRHKNSISQINLERGEELHRLFRQALQIAQQQAGVFATIETVVNICAQLPATRFFISYYWAARYIKARLKGKQKHFRNPRKGILYDALYNEFLIIDKHPDYKNRSFESKVDIALEQPAPCIGLSPTYLKLVFRQELNIYQYDTNRQAILHS